MGSGSNHISSHFLVVNQRPMLSVAAGLKILRMSLTPDELVPRSVKFIFLHA